MSKVYLGIGTNLGNREENIRTCLQAIEERCGRISACSSFFYSKPQDFISKHDFINLVIHLQTSLSPLELLQVTQDIERKMGRTQKSQLSNIQTSKPLIHFDRIIDIDILYYDNLSTIFYDDSGKEILTIPHPRMQERDFVMIPLNEIFERKDA